MHINEALERLSVLLKKIDIGDWSQSTIKCLLEITVDDYFVASNGAVYDAIQAAYLVLRILGYLRNRFALAVICCLIYHWLEVSRLSG